MLSRLEAHREIRRRRGLFVAVPRVYNTFLCLIRGAHVEQARRTRVADKVRQRCGLVSIKSVRQEGKKLAKACEYVCPDNSCDVPVVPVFPDAIKPGRKKSPRDYFRAKSQAHAADCKAEGVTRRKARPGGQSTSESSRRSRQGQYPTRFRATESRAGSRRPGAAAVGVDEVFDQEPQNRKSAGGKASVSHARTVRHLAEWFEQQPEPPSSMPLLGVPGCPGRNYGDVFRTVANAVLEDSAGTAYIYYGSIESFDEYNSGVFIRFTATGHSKPLGVWLAKSLKPQSVFDDITSRMREATRRFRLYALGAFEPKFNGTKYSIELERLVYAWITLKGEN